MKKFLYFLAVAAMLFACKNTSVKDNPQPEDTDILMNSLVTKHQWVQKDVKLMNPNSYTIYKGSYEDSIVFRPDGVLTKKSLYNNNDKIKNTYNWSLQDSVLKITVTGPKTELTLDGESKVILLGEDSLVTENNVYRRTYTKK